MKYGWSAARIIDGYVQHINAVHRVRPVSLGRPGVDTINAPRQCFEFLNELTGAEVLLRKALGDVEPLIGEEVQAYHDCVREIVEALKEVPWEPTDELEAAQPVEFVKVSVAAIGRADEATIHRWIGWGMPHRKRGRCYFVQISVVDRWMRMKFRHRVKHHLTKRRH